MAAIAETPEVIPTSISSSDTTSSTDETTSSSDDDTTTSSSSVKKSSDNVKVAPKEKSSDNVSKKKTTSQKSSPSKSSLVASKKTSGSIIQMTEDAPRMAYKRAQPKKVKMSGSPRSPKLLPPGTTVYIQNEPREDQGGCCGRKKSRPVKSKDNVSPLAESALFGDLDRIAKKAKSHNINVTKDKDKDYKSNDVGANAQPPLHQYPLHLAMQGCHPGAVKLLLEKGANISLEQDLARENIFHVAAFHSNNDGAKEAIDWAAANGKMGEVERLLNPTDLSTMITSPLLAAVVYGNYELVELYIRAGANPEQTDKHGRSTLELAIFWNESWNEREAAGYDPTRQGITNNEMSKRYHSYPKIITLLREKLGLSEDAIDTTIATADVVDYLSSSSSSSSSAPASTTTSITSSSVSGTTSSSS